MEHAAGPSMGFFIGMMVIYILMIALGLAAMIFWIIALIDATRRDFKDSNEKIMWVLVILLAQVIGALVYWFVGREKGVLPGEATPGPPPVVPPPPQ